jgi:hypothetical protein
MGIDIMGRVLTEATIENLEDLWAVKRGLLSADQVRRLVVPDALVDTGATLLSLPTRLVQELGLSKTSSKRVSSSLGLGGRTFTRPYASRSRAAPARWTSWRCRTPCPS